MINMADRQYIPTSKFIYKAFVALIRSSDNLPITYTTGAENTTLHRNKYYLSLGKRECSYG